MDGMIKFVGIGSWPDLAETPVEVLKVRRDGTIGGNDRHDFLQKRGASHIFLDKLADLRLHPDELPIHVIALGAHEAYNCNRNGDSFTEEECERNHHRFVKDARYYMGHKNNDPSKSYGLVKASAYNKPMRRVELLIFGNEKQSAADRNGGLVMPSSTIEKLTNGRMIPWSMACRVQHDICSNCHNKAANRRQYCTEETCVNPENGRRMPGCRFGLTKLGEDGFQQFVYNPDAGWFDISHVSRQADRTALGGLADYMMKRAADDRGHVPGGAELAELFAMQHGGSLGALVETDGIHEQLSLLRKLAGLEQSLETMPPNLLIAAVAGRPKPPTSPYPKQADIRRPGNLQFLIGEGIVLSPTEFFTAAIPHVGFEKAAAASAASRDCLGHCFSLLEGDPELSQLLQANLWRRAAADSFAKLGADESVRRWAYGNRGRCSVGDSWAVSRIMADTANSARAEFRVPKVSFEKVAEAAEPLSQLAKQHALYQLGSLSVIPGILDNTPALLRVLVGNRM